MLYLTHVPRPPLSIFVEHLWLLSDAPTHSLERIFPSGTLELVINLNEDEIRIHNGASDGPCARFSGVVVSGAYGRPFVIDTADQALTMGVHFRPGGAAPFLAAPADELRDAHVDVRNFWGPAAADLRERLCGALTHPQRFRLLEDALIRRAPHAPSGHPAIGFAIGALQRGARVQEVAREVGISHRRLIEVFAREVGMTPKLFSRVSRFQSVLLRARRPSGGDWGQLALECGYFDQSHLIRDFLAFSGFSPTTYLARADAERVKDNHVALG